MRALSRKGVVAGALHSWCVAAVEIGDKSMKGVVFTQFVEMVETTYGAQLADQIIEAANLPSGGAYTAVGTYNHEELIRMVEELSDATGTPAADLVRHFGRCLFARFVESYPQFFVGIENSFTFLRRVDSYIHFEVRKLYPDAQLPSFQSNELGDGCMELIYSSPRPFADLAEGLILGCAEHFGESIELIREPCQDHRGAATRFVILCVNKLPQMAT
jgi:hypothetical protein